MTPLGYIISIAILTLVCWATGLWGFWLTGIEILTAWAVLRVFYLIWKEGEGKYLKEGYIYFIKDHRK
jgi:hypothetical protein